MTDKVGEYKQRAAELMKPFEDLMREAKKEGYAVEVYSAMGTDGAPNSRIAVLLR